MFFKIISILLKILKRKGFIYFGTDDKKRGGFYHYVYPFNINDPETIYLLIYDFLRDKFIRNDIFKSRLKHCYSEDSFKPKD